MLGEENLYFMTCVSDSEENAQPVKFDSPQNVRVCLKQQKFSDGEISNTCVGDYLWTKVTWSVSEQTLYKIALISSAFESCFLIYLGENCQISTWYLYPGVEKKKKNTK